jgi:capsid portal protein
MLSQNKLNVSQSAFLFSIIMHVFIVIVLLNFAVEKNDHITSNIKITLISASSVNHKDAMFLSSKDSKQQQQSINLNLNLNQPPQPQPISETIFNSTAPANTSTENQVPDFFSIDEHVNSSKIEHTYDPLLDAQNRAKKL